MATWYYIVAWHEATSNTCNIQVNNGAVNSSAETGIVSDTAANFRVGAYLTTETYFFDGLIDEVAFYKRVLTSSERSWLYNSGIGRSYADVVAYTTPAPTPTPLPTGWQSRTYAYDANHPHAVSSLAENAAPLANYTYDSNGNMTCRTEEGPSAGSGQATYIQTYNTENRISSIIKLASPSGTCAAPGPFAAKWDFAYDGDGVRVSTLLTPYDETGTPLTPEMTSYYFGGAYETRSDGTAIKYYSFGGQTIGMDDGTGLQYFLTDHLGSVVATTDSTGTLISQQRYLPFGGVRPNVASPSGASTDLGYTGQRNLDADIGLMDYKARFYSPYINRFIQPDTLIPDLVNSQSWNRYSYAINNPILYNDPDGHCAPVCAFAAIPPLVLIAATVALIATVYIVVTPRDQINKDLQTIGYAMDKATIRIINALQAKKPLTPDEKKKIGQIDATEGFLKGHPDIASDALRKAKGEKLPKGMDHAHEAEDWLKGLGNAIDHLTGVRRSRDEAAQGAIDGAIARGKRWIDSIKRKLRGE